MEKKYSRYLWHNLYNVDFLSAARQLPAETINTSILHPPSLFYSADGRKQDYLKYVQWCRDWVTQVNRMSKPKGVVWIVGSNDTLLTVGQLFLELGWYTVNFIRLLRPHLKRSHEIHHWDSRQATFCVFMAKRNGYYFNSDYLHENFVWKARNSWVVYDLREDEIKHGRHPEQLSDMMVDWMVRITTPVDGGVLDPFAGVATTPVVCERAVMNWIAFEQKEEWFNIGLKRLLDVKYNMMGGK